MNPKYSKIFWRNAVVFLLTIMLVFPNGVDVARAAPGDVTRVSVDSSGVQGNGFSYTGHISADGRFVVFDSESSNLVANDTNANADVFLRNLQLGTTVRVSVNAAGAQVNDGSGAPSISADGRYVAFESNSSDLVAGDTNNFIDIFVKDMQTGAISRVSVDSAGVQADSDSADSYISGDGRYVIFNSEASNLVANDVNGSRDVFIHDRQTGITKMISAGANASVFDASISLDGNFVVFSSSATNLVVGDTNGKTDIFVYAVQTGQITRVSINSSGVQADKGATEPSISGDGRYVTFSSASENLMSVDTLGFTYVYVHDRVTTVTSLVSFINGYPMYGTADASFISANGRYIAFSYDDRGDGMPRRWLYIHDRVAGVTLSPIVGGNSEGTDNPIFPSLPADGRFLAFASGSTSLVPGDTNGMRDIFVKEISYPVDLNPAVTSVLHGCPSGCISSADQKVDFLVKFSEPVTGVDVTDFVLTISGGISGATVSTVSGAGSDYIVRVDTGTGDGTLRLDVLDDDSIKDIPLNPLGGVGVGNGSFTTGEIYKVDKSIVSVTSILRVDPSLSSNASVRFAVNFSEAATGVDVSDFSLATTGLINGVVVTEVSGSGTAYTVTVNTGTGDGTLRLDLLDNDSILDFISIPLGGLGSNNGNFITGEIYTLDKSAPLMLSSLRMDANPTAAAVVHFNVTFSEPVSGVDVGDFILNTTGVPGAMITEVAASGNAYIVTVNTGAGNGTIRLDLMDNDSIVDAVGIPLGGAGVGNGNFTIGDVYTITKLTYITTTEKIRSTGNNDGWILESKETSNQGYARNSTAATLFLGDNASDRQYRVILHFPTLYLPDDAVINKVILMIRAQRVIGKDPFTTHGNVSIDIRYGSFGAFGPFAIKALQASDFQAPASRTAVGLIQNNPVGGWYWAMLDSSAFSSINLTGITQLRLAFQLDDNDDRGDDYLMFFSGDYVDQKDRPHLVIEYTVAR